MRRHRRWLRALLGATALFAMLAASPAFADWRDDYARGLEAANDGKWADAAKYMQDAMKGNAEPAKRVRLYGQRWETYAPQHYAGLAAYKQGDCVTAQRLWSSSAHKSFISGFDQFAAAEAQANKDCEIRLAQAKPATPAGKPIATTTLPAPVVVPKPPPAQPKPVVVEKPPTRVASTPARAPSAADQLRPFIEGYLAGDYNRVAALAVPNTGDARLRAQMQLFRAAASYRDASLNGSDNGMASARAAVSEARKADSSLRPDATFFSPRFLAFFNGTQ